MNLFKKLLDKLFPVEESKPVPGAMGDILAKIGIHELGPVQKGTPFSVLTGCKPLLVQVPGTGRPAITREGRVMKAKDKHGKEYTVMDNYAVSSKQWKMMQNDQKRKAAGRWFSGAQAA